MTCETSAAMRRLWCAVLYEQLRLAIGANRDADKYPKSDQQRAVDWIGGRDFGIVCSLAGLDPDAVERGVRARVAEGRPLTKCAAGQAKSRGLGGRVAA